MMTHCTQTTQQMEERWLSPLVGSLVVATVVMATLQPVGLADAAECVKNDDTVAVQGTPSWDAIIPPLQTQSGTVTRDCACELTPYLTRNRFALGRTYNSGITALPACLSPNSEKMAPLAHTTLGPIHQLNSKMQPLRVSILSYNSKKHEFTIRTTLPKIKRSLIYTPAATIIGPVQEFQNAPPSDERSMTEAIPSVPPMDQPPALSGNHPRGLFKQFQGLQQLSNGESHRMNMTTALALHGRDCVSDCP
jgi:hypothetical protein